MSIFADDLLVWSQVDINGGEVRLANRSFAVQATRWDGIIKSLGVTAEVSSRTHEYYFAGDADNGFGLP